MNVHCLDVCFVEASGPMFVEAAREIAREWSRLATRVSEVTARLEIYARHAASEASAAMACRPPNTSAASRATARALRLAESKSLLISAHASFQSKFPDVNRLSSLAALHASRFSSAAEELWDIRSTANGNPLAAKPYLGGERSSLAGPVLLGCCGGAAALRACAQRIGQLQSGWRDGRATRAIAVSVECLACGREVMAIVERHEHLIERIASVALST
jgi:hypothetical protein